MRIFSTLIIISIFITQKNIAQNVGIGTTTPQKTLDVKGNFRSGGSSIFISHDSTSGNITWSNSNLFVPTPQYLMKHSASAEGLYSNGAQLEYRNQLGNPAFFTNWTNGNGYFGGKLGINNNAPQFPISLDGSLGDKISLWTDGTPTHYGFGIQSSLFQMFSKTSFDDIGFGYGSSTSFVEAMRIKGNGNIGIGTITPASKLEITHNGGSVYGTALLINQNVIGNSDGPKIQFNKTMTSSKSWTAGILNGVNISTFGISEDGGTGGFGTPRFTIAQGGNVGIGTSSPNAALGFPPLLGKKITLYPGTTGDVGFAVAGNRLQIYSDNPNADVAVGYDAAGTFNERFAFKPNGALAVNGNTGNPGEILQSNGSGSAATWTNPIDPNAFKTQYYQAYIASVVLTNASSSYTINVPVTVYVNSIITVSISVNISTANYIGCDHGEMAISIQPLGGGGLVGSAGSFQTFCGGNKNTVASGELPLLASDGSMKIFAPGTGIGAIVTFVKTNTGPDLSIGNTGPARIIVKVIPQ